MGIRAWRLSRANAASEEGATLAVSGDFAGAESYWRKALTLREKAGEPAHPDQLRDLHWLAWLLLEMDRLDEAEAAARRSMARAGEGPVEDAEGRLRTLASILCEKGAFEEAERCAHEALAHSKAEDEAAATLSVLARILDKADRIEEAEPFVLRALAIRRAADDPARALDLVTLGRINVIRGDFAAAEPLYREAVDVEAARADGDELPLAARMSNLGWMLTLADKREEALEVLRRGHDILERQLPPTHPDRLLGLSNLAGVLHDLERYGEAAALYREALDGVEAGEGKDHEDYFEALGKLAYALENDGRFDEATPFRRARLAHLAEQSAGPGELVAALTDLGWNLAEGGDLEAAEAPYAEALRLSVATFGREGARYAQALNNWAWLVGSAGRYEEAEALHREALRLRADTPGVGSEAYFDSVSNLAWVLWRTGRSREAEAVVRDGLAARPAPEGPHDPSLARDLRRVARMFRSEGDAPTALEFYRDAAEAFRHALGPRHEEAEAIFEEMADAGGPGGGGPRLS